MTGALTVPTRRPESEGELMAATLTHLPRRSDSERLRRRRDRHARLATDSAMTEVAFKLRARERRARQQRPAIAQQA